MPVSVLFCRKNSVYKALGLDCWDDERDARNWNGSNPIVAHPPCAQWGLLRKFANPCPATRALAPFAVEQVRRVGGVLEHPAFSKLWEECSLPAPGVVDRFGGFTFPVEQLTFGHRARKKTFLYIVGLRPSDLPPFDLSFDYPTHVVFCSRRKRADRLPELSRAGREATPIRFAEWLVAIASRCRVPGPALPA